MPQPPKHPAVSLTPATSLKVALWLMEQTHAPALPVLEHGRFRGVVLRDDLLRYAPSPATTLSKWELPDLLEAVSIRDEMLIRQIPQLALGAPMSKVIGAMREEKCPVIALVDGGHLFQLISWRDVLDEVDSVGWVERSEAQQAELR